MTEAPRRNPSAQIEDSLNCGAMRTAQIKDREEIQSLSCLEHLKHKTQLRGSRAAVAVKRTALSPTLQVMRTYYAGMQEYIAARSINTSALVALINM